MTGLHIHSHNDMASWNKEDVELIQAEVRFQLAIDIAKHLMLPVIDSIFDSFSPFTQ